MKQVDGCSDTNQIQIIVFLRYLRKRNQKWFQLQLESKMTAFVRLKKSKPNKQSIHANIWKQIFFLKELSICNINSQLQINVIRVDISHRFVYFTKKQGMNMKIKLTLSRRGVLLMKILTLLWKKNMNLNPYLTVYMF